MDMDALITLIIFYFVQYLHKYVMIISIPKFRFKLIHFKLQNCNIYALKNANEITKLVTKY